VGLRGFDVAQGKEVLPRAMVMQHETHRQVQFEITEQTRQYARIAARWIESIGLDASVYGTHTI
jgi:hypothetical protein